MFRTAENPSIWGQLLHGTSMLLVLGALAACGDLSTVAERAPVPGAERPFPKLSTVPERPNPHIPKSQAAVLVEQLEKELRQATAIDAALRKRTKDTIIVKQ